MRRLFHFPLSPQGRTVRLALAEKGVEVESVPTLPWAPDPMLASLDADAEPPCLAVGERPVTGEGAILEFLEETGPGRRLLPVDPFERAETRRLGGLAARRFFEDTVQPLLRERVEKKLRNAGAPDTDAMRAALTAAAPHYDALERLLDRRRWLAGEELTVADFAVAAQLSTLDYMGDVPWDTRPVIKEWYALMKSRPAFREILNDRLKGMPPAPHYHDLDF